MGVAISTQGITICMSPEGWYQTTKKTFTNGHYGPSVLAAGNVERSIYWKTGVGGSGEFAGEDFNGYENTQEILANSANVTGTTTDNIALKGSPAASYCYEYSRGCKGAGEWYLPAYGELYIIKTNLEEFNSAMEKISGNLYGDPNGGDTVNNGKLNYICSSQMDAYSGIIHCYRSDADMWVVTGTSPLYEIIGNVRPCCRIN